MRRSFRFAAWVFLGTLLVQSAWILTLPPFRGIDEFDHVYQAASVADGHWLPSGERPDDGRGELVRVSPGIVRDAAPICESLEYTGHDNCNPDRVLDDDTVTVASGAARYNPVFYFLVGTTAQPFDGAPAMYVMRVTAAVLCSLLLAVAGWATTRWARTWWPPAALVTVLTPVMVYSSAVPGPNGIEMCAAAAVWCCLLGIDRVDAADQRRLLVLAGLCAVPLATVRGLGPLWLAALCLVALAHVGPSRTWALVRAMPRVALASGAIVTAACLAAAGWTFGVDSMAPEEGGPYPDPLGATLRKVPLWFLQSIAAFPIRDEPAPPVVYAAAGAVLAGMLALGIARGDRRSRAVLGLAFGLALLLPFGLSVMTHETTGPIWQGRYGWPLSMGVLLLCGAALDVRPPKHRLVGPGALAAALLWVVAHAVSNANIARNEQRDGVFATDDRWVTVEPWLIAVMTAVGVLIWTVGVHRTRPAEESPRSTHIGQKRDLLSTGDR